MDAAIVVVLDGNAEQALRCFSSLAALPERPEHEVIVVDNASIGLEELLGQLGGDVAVVRSDVRLGFGQAVALGSERARADVIAMLRGAPEVGSDWLSPLLARLQRTGGAASVTVGSEAMHPVAAQALAVRKEDLRFPEAPEGLEIAALCAAVGAESVPQSIVYPASARTGGARRSPGEEPELTVVIPTLDATADRVRRCVAAVQNATEVPHEIVLVDNGAPPQGFTAPVNAGLRAMAGSYAVVMNDDVEVLPGWWAPLRDALDQGAAAVFPVTTDSANRSDFAAWCFAMSRASISEHSHAPGVLFDPRFRVWFQDTDLLERLRAAGNPPVVVAESRIRHGLSETVATHDPELRAWIEAEIERDRRAFAQKHPASSTLVA